MYEEYYFLDWKISISCLLYDIHFPIMNTTILNLMKSFHFVEFFLKFPARLEVYFLLSYVYSKTFSLCCCYCVILNMMSFSVGLLLSYRKDVDFHKLIFLCHFKKIYLERWCIFANAFSFSIEFIIFFVALVTCYGFYIHWSLTLKQFVLLTKSHLNHTKWWYSYGLFMIF